MTKALKDSTTSMMSQTAAEALYEDFLQQAFLRWTNQKLVSALLSQYLIAKALLLRTASIDLLPLQPSTIHHQHHQSLRPVQLHHCEETGSQLQDPSRKALSVKDQKALETELFPLEMAAPPHRGCRPERLEEFRQQALDVQAVTVALQTHRILEAVPSGVSRRVRKAVHVLDRVAPRHDETSGQQVDVHISSNAFAVLVTLGLQNSTDASPSATSPLWPH
jgi:hypothetical protein